MRKVRKLLRGVAAALLCLGLLCGGALADVTTPVSEEPEELMDIDWEEFKKEQVIPFPDVPEDATYAQAVGSLAQMGVITGDEKGNFNPNDTINRAEVAAIICRITGVEDDAKGMKNVVFTDVPSTHWAVGYVAKAVEHGVINGYGNGTFGPSNPVTYAQMVKMLVCAWGYEEEAQAKGGWPNGYLQVANERGYTEGIRQNDNDEIARSTVILLIYNSFK